MKMFFDAASNVQSTSGRIHVATYTNLANQVANHRLCERVGYIPIDALTWDILRVHVTDGSVV